MRRSPLPMILVAMLYLCCSSAKLREPSFEQATPERKANLGPENTSAQMSTVNPTRTRANRAADPEARGQNHAASRLLCIPQSFALRNPSALKYPLRFKNKASSASEPVLLLTANASFRSASAVCEASISSPKQRVGFTRQKCSLHSPGPTCA
jgi:hypothetical protein